MKGKKHLIYAENTVDFETGELKETKERFKVPREPDFVKLYLDDLMHLNDLPKWVSSIFYELMKQINYSNEIVLNSTIKKRIAEQKDINPRTIDNALTQFIKKELLIRNGRGVYLVNPYIVARGTWYDIMKMRDNWNDLKITTKVTYSKKGKKVSSEMELKINDEAVKEIQSNS